MVASKTVTDGSREPEGLDAVRAHTERSARDDPSQLGRQQQTGHDRVEHVAAG
jgi:hypothetical protein